MIAAARWRLLDVSRRIAQVRRGTALLEQRREALVRELVRRHGALTRRQAAFADRYAHAQMLLHEALERSGLADAMSAASAQRPSVDLTYHAHAVMGVRLPHVAVAVSPFRIDYGPADTHASLDRAAHAFAELLPLAVELAEEDTAIRRLREASRKVTRTLNALKSVVLPGLQTEARQIAGALEDEDRDEHMRRTRSA
jgi:H(+)-transporting ATP synthase subunit D